MATTASTEGSYAALGGESSTSQARRFPKRLVSPSPVLEPGQLCCLNLVLTCRGGLRNCILTSTKFMILRHWALCSGEKGCRHPQKQGRRPHRRRSMYRRCSTRQSHPQQGRRRVWRRGSQTKILQELMLICRLSLLLEPQDQFLHMSLFVHGTISKVTTCLVVDVPAASASGLQPLLAMGEHYELSMPPQPSLTGLVKAEHSTEALTFYPSEHWNPDGRLAFNADKELQPAAAHQ
jgi:hypothetical protein